MKAKDRKKSSDHDQQYKDMKLGFWKRLGWFLTYYRLQIFGVIAALCVIGYIVYLNVRPQREQILNVMMVNGNSACESDLFDRYLDEAGYDIRTETAYVSNGIWINFDGTDSKAWDYFEIVTAQFLTGEIDLFISDGEIFTRFANYGAFMDVSEYLTEEQLERYADSILYVTDTDTGEQMACGIILGPETQICQEQYFLETCYLGLSSNVYNDVEAEAVLNLILEELP